MPKFHGKGQHYWIEHPQRTQHSKWWLGVHMIVSIDNKFQSVSKTYLLKSIPPRGHGNRGIVGSLHDLTCPEPKFELQPLWAKSSKQLDEDQRGRCISKAHIIWMKKSPTRIPSDWEPPGIQTLISKPLPVSPLGGAQPWWAVFVASSPRAVQIAPLLEVLMSFIFGSSFDA